MGYLRRRRSSLSMIFGKWGIIVALSLLVNLTCFTARRTLTKDTDFLGGRDEVACFLRINATCLVLTMLATAACIGVFFVACVNKNNSDIRKPAACVTALIVSVFSCVAFGYSTANIASDLSSTTTARPATYVLCTDGKAAHYVGFTDKEEMALIPVTEKTYDALSKGHELSDKTHCEVYKAIVSRGYDAVTEYDSAARIEYYFNSAMIEKAELLFE